MKFLILRDCFVEGSYLVKGTIQNLPDKYLKEPTVFQPVESAPEPEIISSTITNLSEESPLYISDKPKKGRPKKVKSGD